jgi:hypothetical protein
MMRRDGRPITLLIAAVATLLATVLSARAIAHAQWGPRWEVPAAVVMELDVARLASILLLPTAVGLMLWSVRTNRRPAAFLLLSAQVALAGVLAFFASPDEAARWPTRHPRLSEHAGELALAAALVSALLAAVGIAISRRSRSARGSDA